MSEDRLPLYFPCLPCSLLLSRLHVTPQPLPSHCPSHLAEMDHEDILTTCSFPLYNAHLIHACAVLALASTVFLQSENLRLLCLKARCECIASSTCHYGSIEKELRVYCQIIKRTWIKKINKILRRFQC